MIDSAGQAWPPPISTWVDTPDQALRVVLDAKEAGYDGVKVHSFMSPECCDSILRTAHEFGMPATGHIPDALSVEYILTAGQNLIAHADEVMKGVQGAYSPARTYYLADIITNSNIWITPTLNTRRKILAIFDDLDQELVRSEMGYLHPIAKGI